ncbi:hypothetical protein [Xanthomonas bromi]|uniref:hypothetical protein n=1 Tax=Xanthomonas bromi TaxID=56449 RepID=UPI001428AFC8|nr:hypothetical protein [Xanthomonas bromi]
MWQRVADNAYFLSASTSLVIALHAIAAEILTLMLRCEAMPCEKTHCLRIHQLDSLASRVARAHDCPRRHADEG